MTGYFPSDPQRSAVPQGVQAMVPPPPAPAASFSQPDPFGAPQRERGRVSGKVVAAIATGSLVLGLAGGFGGAALWQSLDVGAQGPVTLPPASITTGDVVADNAYAAVIEAALPSVVQIEVASGGQPVSSGSGFVIESDGYLLTNNHVVDVADPSITVIFADGSHEKAELVGATADYDLAVLKVDRSGLAPLVLGDSDAVAVGDTVIAIGSPLGLGSTVTTGIISALHRPVTTSDETSQAFIDALQTDAAINPGNSGGPLLNMKGEVIGINSAVAAMPGATSMTGAGSVGLGFAIPSNQARHTAEQLIEFGYATYPVVGVLLDSRYQGEGVKVVEESDGVVANGPADRAGIRPGDVITAFDGRPVSESNVLIVGIRAKKAGDTVTFTILRDGEEFDVSVTLTDNDQVSFDGPSTEPGVGEGGEDGSE